jgi:hypothetical protein
VVEEEEEEVNLMVSTLSFIQTNLQHSIAVSKIFTRTVSNKGIDMTLIQELWYHENCIRGLNIPGYTLYLWGACPVGCCLDSLAGTW